MKESKIFKGEAEREIRPLPKCAGYYTNTKDDGSLYRVSLFFHELRYLGGDILGSVTARKQLILKKRYVVLRHFPNMRKTFFGKLLSRILTSVWSVLPSSLIDRRACAVHAMVWQVGQGHVTLIRHAMDKPELKNEWVRENVSDELANKGVILNDTILEELIHDCMKNVMDYVEERRAYADFSVASHSVSV